LSINSRNSLPVILLFGPTAAGKTELVSALFAGRGEIINADSEQVYRFLFIGTAKPDTAVLARVPHHLIDVLEPTEQFTVGDFVRSADRLAGEISARGMIPVLSGGAAFYIRHFVFGLPSAPASDPAVREAVKKELKEKGSRVLHEELTALDPAGAAKIHPADGYRVSRALEVIRQTGKPLSFFQLSLTPREAYRFLSIGLTLSREELKERINRRVEAMFAAGLEEEITRLRARGYDSATPGLRGIGYREFFEAEKNNPTTEEIKAAIKLHSVQYAKRQMTFFRQIPGTLWFHPAQREEIKRVIGEFLAKESVLPSFPAPEDGPGP
jgi:tRNA dimethylallyltransferase